VFKVESLRQAQEADLYLFGRPTSTDLLRGSGPVVGRCDPAVNGAAVRLAEQAIISSCALPPSSRSNDVS
jgi:hypothetical protein